jgi:uncharacterized membrane protein
MTSLTILLQSTTPPSDWAIFFGRFHPLLVHLPIGFLLVVIILEILRFFGKSTVSQEVIRQILLISAFSATLACGAGYLLAMDGGYNEEILEEHKWQGIWLAVLCWVGWLSLNNWFNDKVPFASILYVPALIFSTIMMFVAGHHGGNLTHGETYLTDNTPQPFRTWLGLPPKEEKIADGETKKIANVDEAVVFNDIIKPIIKTKCESCHNASKMKGDLRMDTIELLKKGGEHGAIFVDGKSDESTIMKRILLPESNDEHMPPKGKNQPSENEIALIRWWIDNGASFDKKVKDLAQNDQIKPILASLGAGVATGVVASTASLIKQDKFEIEEKLLAQNPSAASTGSIEDLKKTGALVLPFSQNNNYLEISFINNRNFSDNEAAVLSKLPDQTLWVRLSDTKISDKTVDELIKLKNLTRLHLENTKITDAGIAKLSALQNLEYINLIGTGITDAGLKQLANCKNLKKIYLWQSKATQAGVDELKKVLPNAQMDLGITAEDVTKFLSVAPQPETEKKEEKRK